MWLKGSFWRKQSISLGDGEHMLKPRHPRLFYMCMVTCRALMRIERGLHELWPIRLRVYNVRLGILRWMNRDLKKVC